MDIWLTMSGDRIEHFAPAANVWPLIVTIAFLVGFMIGFPLGGEDREWIALGATGLLTGTITALGITWLLREQTVVAA